MLRILLACCCLLFSTGIFAEVCIPKAVEIKEHNGDKRLVKPISVILNRYAFELQDDITHSLIKKDIAIFFSGINKELIGVTVLNYSGKMDVLVSYREHNKADITTMWFAIHHLTKL